VDLIDLCYAVLGLAALLAGLLPRLLASRPLSMPIVFLGLGMALFALPLGLPDPNPLRHPHLTERLTEIGVIVALMGAGLKLDRRLGWRSWSTTWRLLAIAMPLTIAGTALLGWWWVGLAPAAAMLLGSALAPTDPVLASDVQVGEPGGHEEGEDVVRFSLTSEAGLNDALAFPFVYAAIAMAAQGANPAAWIGEWLAVDVVYKVVVGIAVGALVGRMLGWLFFRARSDTARRRSRGATDSSRCSWPRCRSARRNGRTSTTRCSTTSPSRSSGCSPSCCWSCSVALSSAGSSARSRGRVPPRASRWSC
jgi:NhaP-type Na+/H+ or K+/H+ antiporter